MSKIIGFVLGTFILALTLCVPLTHAIAFPQVMNEYNGIFFENAEVLVDRNGDGEVSVGDTFWGVLCVQNIKAPTDVSGTTGTNIWMQGGAIVPPAEITGYFATDVVNIFPIGHPDNPYGKAIIQMGAAAVDPNNILNPGEIIRLFDDSANNYNNSTQALGLATATDGTHVWSLGLGASTDGDSLKGYYYSLTPVVPPGSGNVGKAYAGLNFMYPGDDLFDVVNDPNDDWSTWDFANNQASGNGLDVEIWFNSELIQINPITDTTYFHFGSNDPAVYKPLEEELPGDCRVTAGGNKDGVPCALKLNGLPDNNCIKEKINHTWGGQAGAGPNLDPNINWIHHYKESNEVSFVFQSNDKDPICIMCSDPGNFCFPARYAPYRQIDFVGIGQFNTIKGFGEDFDVGEVCFEVHLEDIGEPGRGGKWPISGLDCEHCPGTPIVNGDPDDLTSRSDCRDCTDYYEIKIYDSAEHGVCGCTGNVLWVNGLPHSNCDAADPHLEGFFTRSGNVQMHPDN